MKRGVKRDIELLGGFENTWMKYKSCYHKASKIYIKENKPEEIADIVIDNTDFNDLVIVKSFKHET